MAALAGTSARPVHHVMLHGDLTGQTYGWATPAEVERMLAEGFGPDSCPLPPSGSPDRFLMPGITDYYFWLSWYDRRGVADQWVTTTHVPHPVMTEPEVTFYLGTHRPYWLWNGAVDYPLCVSYSTLGKVRNFRRGRVPWICDSRAFSEITKHGRWTISPGEYIRFLARADDEIGGLEWAGPQDWPCEKATIHGGYAEKVPAVGTGLSVLEHQARTVANFLVLRELWPQYSDRPCPVIPVLQGDSPDAYLQCYDMYQRAGVELGSDHTLVGVGSVCRLQSTSALRDIAKAVGSLNLSLHWFGLKLTGLAEPALLRDLTDIYAEAGTVSCDSASWSDDAREGKGRRHPECTHLGRKGQPNRCNNCVRYATWWRATKMIPALRAATWSPGRDQVQGELFAVSSR